MPLANSSFLSKVTKPSFRLITTLKAIKGNLAYHQLLRRARPSLPNNPINLLPTQLIKFKHAAPENKIKRCTLIINLRPITPMPPGYSDFSWWTNFLHLMNFVLKNDINLYHWEKYVIWLKSGLLRLYPTRPKNMKAQPHKFKQFHGTKYSEI